MSGPWYVDASGEVFTYAIHSLDTIMLSNGKVVNPDQEDCKMFAVEESALACSKSIRENFKMKE